MLFNGTALAHVTGRALSVAPGDNTGVIFEALWSPLAAGGDIGIIAGRELLSSYVSGIYFSAQVLGVMLNIFYRPQYHSDTTSP